MNCRTAITLLHLDRRGERSPSDERRLAEHLAGCPTCSREAESLRRVRAVWDETRSSATPDAHIASAADRILRDLPSASARRSWLNVIVSLVERPTFRLAYAIITLAAGLGLLGQWASMPGPAEAATSGERRSHIAFVIETNHVRAIVRSSPAGLPQLPEGPVEVRKDDLPRLETLTQQMFVRTSGIARADLDRLEHALSSLQRTASITIRLSS